MGATLGLIAVHGRAGMAEYEAVLSDRPVLEFANRVTMKFDPEIDSAYPARWIGKVSVVTTGGETLQCQVDEPKGDPGNTLTADELDAESTRPRPAQWCGAKRRNRMMCGCGILAIAGTPTCFRSDIDFGCNEAAMG